MMKFNLHTHTKRCNHANGEDREYVEAAIAAGMKVLGFADHCPQFFPDTDYYSFFRMHPEQALEYVESVRALQKEYAADIQILLGFETEYYPKTFDALMAFVRPLHLDYMIMGQHFVGNEYDEGSYYAAEEGKREDYLRHYVRQVKEGLATGAFTYLAHPDIVWYCGGEEEYRRQSEALCRFAKEHHIPLEFNMLGYVNGRSYPNPAFWQVAAAVGNEVVIGYDAHDPKALRNDSAYADCLRLLDGYGLQPISFEEIILRNEKL